jgi:hypothetical protein
MPSPKGTNREGLFLHGRASAAYDEEPATGEGKGMRAMRFLASKLDPDDWAALREYLLDGEMSEDGDDPELPDNATQGGMGGRLSDEKRAMDEIGKHLRRIKLG